MIVLFLQSIQATHPYIKIGLLTVLQTWTLIFRHIGNLGHKYSVESTAHLKASWMRDSRFSGFSRFQDIPVSPHVQMSCFLFPDPETNRRDFFPQSACSFYDSNTVLIPARWDHEYLHKKNMKTLYVARADHSYSKGILLYRLYNLCATKNKMNVNFDLLRIYPVLTTIKSWCMY